MSSKGDYSNLARFIHLNENNRSLAGLGSSFRSVCPDKGKFPDDPRVLQPIYEESCRFLESSAAEKGFGGDLLALQRELYKEFEQILSSYGEDRRHNFLIVIPVADRPLMLRNCLSSLIEQCRIFSYGGLSGDTAMPFYKKVSVLVFDDSKDEANIIEIKKICSSPAAAAVRTIYVGSEDQAEVLRKVPPKYKEKLSGVVGDFSGAVYPHKGASLTRNIAALYIQSRLREFGKNILIWFIDSDEEFKINSVRGGEIKDIHFVNYFYWLDRIFSDSDIEVLTGKVVGDPPVTPAVMINTFLEDVLSFFDTVSRAKTDSPCIFHSDLSSGPFSAEYHDMTGLFGYRKSDVPKRYHCSLQGKHTIRDCFADFSNRASGFFSGLHPTRTQFYLHNGHLLRTDQARTVYTGNYIIRLNGLRYFHPFAALGLRMAGPTLGRILRRNLGGKFASANLPLLHKRTGSENHSHEFRNGVFREGEMLDLSGEFVRQFWGDVMLFSVDELTEKIYPAHIDEKEIADAVKNTEQRMWKLYRHHQAEVAGKISRIKKHLQDPGAWWNLEPESKGSVRNFLGFCAIVDKNFGPHSAALKKISGQIEEGSMKQKIIRAIESFPEEERIWGEVLKAISGKPG